MRPAHLLLLAWVALLGPRAAGGQLLVGVAPDLPGSFAGDEAVALGCVQACDLAGLRLTDGEGWWAVPAGTRLPAGGELWVAANLTAWRRFGGFGPAVGGLGLRLGNEGDALQLLAADGDLLDAVAWGNATVGGQAGRLPSPAPGQVLLRDQPPGHGPGAWVDSGRAADWVTPRIHRVGESRLDRPLFLVHDVTLYASPDSSFEVLAGIVGAARERLWLHVYELRSPALVDLLVAAKQAHPGLDLHVLVDASPVGQTASERHATADALRRVVAAGGQAWLADGGRHDDWHQKVLLADGTVAVQSENWVESGVPQDPTWGNRGWGAAVADAALADWFAGWMAGDRAGWGVEPFDLAGFDPLFPGWDRSPPRTGSHSPVPPLRLAGDFTVEPILSPDHTQDPRSDPLAVLVRGGRRVLAQQLDLATGARNRLGWSSPDPLLATLEGAARGGAEVTVQAAAPFSAEDTGNAAALERLTSAGVRTSVFARPGLAALHNKGLVVDDAVFLGSMNGNHHSRSANREAGLLLRGPGVADWFRALAASDLGPPEPSGDPGVVARDLRALPVAPWPTLLALLLVVALVRRC